MTPARRRSAPLHMQQPVVGAVDRGGKHKDCAERSDEAVCALLSPEKSGRLLSTLKTHSNCLSMDMSGYRAKCPVKERHSEMIIDIIRLNLMLCETDIGAANWRETALIVIKLTLS